MKRTLLSLSLLLTLLVAGCKSPNTVAYRTLGGVAQTVHTAYAAWCDYLVTEQLKVSELSPIERGSRESELLRKEGRVLNAYAEYQRVMLAAKAGQFAAVSAGRDAVAPPELVGAASALITLTKELRK